MADVASIYPIRQLYFQCRGCKAQWMVRPEPPIRNIVELMSFTGDPRCMEPCPRHCGATRVDMLFKAGTLSDAPADGPKVDPFTLFDKTGRGGC